MLGGVRLPVILVASSLVLDEEAFLFLVHLSANVLSYTGRARLYQASIMLPALRDLRFWVPEIFGRLSGQRKMLGEQVVVFELQLLVLLLGRLVLAAVEYFQIYHGVCVLGILLKLLICHQIVRSPVASHALHTVANQIFVVGLHDGGVLVLLVGAYGA